MRAMPLMHSPVSTPRSEVLIASAFLSGSTGVRMVCEDLADGLRSCGRSVLATSAIKRRLLCLFDMLATVWLKRSGFAVAQLDVYGGLHLG